MLNSRAKSKIELLNVSKEVDQLELLNKSKEGDQTKILDDSKEGDHKNHPILKIKSVIIKMF